MRIHFSSYLPLSVCAAVSLPSVVNTQVGNITMSALRVSLCVCVMCDTLLCACYRIRVSYNKLIMNVMRGYVSLVDNSAATAATKRNLPRGYTTKKKYAASNVQLLLLLASLSLCSRQRVCAVCCCYVQVLDSRIVFGHHGVRFMMTPSTCV